MRLLNDGDRYNYITLAANKFALVSRWQQKQNGFRLVVTPPVQRAEQMRRVRRRPQVLNQYLALI